MVKEGMYTIEEVDWNKWARTFIPQGISWKDYVIEFDVKGYAGGMDVMLRSHGTGDRVTLYTRNEGSYQYLCWWVHEGGQKRKECENRVEGPLPPNAHIRVEVKGDTYTVYVNGVKRTSFKDNTFSQGMVGLGLARNKDFRFDNFRVLKLE